jgi:hypothetical protein
MVNSSLVHMQTATATMSKWILLPCLLVLAEASAVAADVRLDSYRHPENERSREFNQLYLDGARGGLMAYNALLYRHGQPAFCMPADLILTTERTEEIMLSAADKTSAKDDALVASLLLYGLRHTFPCDKPKGR